MNQNKTDGAGSAGTSPATPSLREQFDVAVANLITAARAAGFERGRGRDDEAANRAEDEAVAELHRVAWALLAAYDRAERVSPAEPETPRSGGRE